MLLGAVVYLGACYGIGQYFHGGTNEPQTAASAAAAAPGQSTAVIYEGTAETTDNPWGVTAGTIELEDEGSCIFLTPNTAALLQMPDDTNEISLTYRIHPWVSGSSDGAGLLIWYLDAENELLGEDTLSVNAEEDWQEASLDLYAGTQKIKILCNNGGKNDDCGDWVLVKQKFSYGV